MPAVTAYHITVVWTSVFALLQIQDDKVSRCTKLNLTFHWSRLSYAHTTMVDSLGEQLGSRHNLLNNWSKWLRPCFAAKGCVARLIHVHWKTSPESFICRGNTRLYGAEYENIASKHLYTVLIFSCTISPIRFQILVFRPTCVWSWDPVTGWDHFYMNV